MKLNIGHKMFEKLSIELITVLPYAELDFYEFTKINRL